MDLFTATYLGVLIGFFVLAAAVVHAAITRSHE